jgi:hypothetical protein
MTLIRIVNYVCFIVKATVFMIVNYNCCTFIVQATELILLYFIEYCVHTSKVHAFILLFYLYALQIPL